MSIMGKKLTDNPMSFAGVDVTYIPKKLTNNTFDNSAMHETDTEIISTKTIQVPSGSVLVGLNVTATDIAGFLSVIAQAFEQDQTFFTQNALFYTQEDYDSATHGDGIMHPARFNMLPARWQDTVPFEFQTLSGNKTTFPYVTETNLIVRQVKLRLASPVSNVRLIVERLQDDFVTWRPVWENVQQALFDTGNGGYNLVAGENVIQLPVVNLGRSQEIFRATFETTESELPLLGVITDLGLGSAFYPFLMIEAQDWFFTDVPNTYDVNQDNNGDFDIQTTLNTSGDVIRRTELAEIDGLDDQPDFSVTPPYERDWGFVFTQVGDATFKSLSFKAVDAHTKALFTIDDETDPDIDFEPVFNTIDIVAGDNTITFSQEALLKDGHDYNVSLFTFDGNNDTDAGIRLFTDIAQNPYFKYRITPLVKEPLVEEAPQDGKNYERRDKAWIKDSYGFMCTDNNTIINSGTGLNKVAGTYAAPSFLDNFTHSGGTLTYTGIETLTTIINVNVSCIISAFAFEEYDFICKVNGVEQANKGCSSVSNLEDPSSVGFQVPIQLNTNDYIEIFAENVGGANPFTVGEMQVSVR